MVKDAKISGLKSFLCICFLLLIIRGFSSASSSSKTFVILYSLARICLGNLLDEERHCLVCCRHSLNLEVLTPEVEALCTPMGTSCSGIC